MLFIFSFFTFSGKRCEVCKPGYYGLTCKPCQCPSTDPKNNFANSCDINPLTTELVCKCRQGYAGLRCEKCADGYYGNPTQPGGSCKQCMCSGNIDLGLTGLCSIFGWEILRSLYKAFLKNYHLKPKKR